MKKPHFGCTAFTLTFLFVRALPAAELYNLGFSGSDTGTYQVLAGSPAVQSTVGPLNDALVFHATAGGEQIRLPIGAVGSSYSLQCDVLTHNLLNSDYAFALSLDTPSVRGVNFHGGLDSIYLFETSPSLDLGLNDLADDTVYHVAVSMDVQSDVWSVAIDGTTLFTGAWNGGPLQDIRFGIAPWIGGAADAPGTYAGLDNVVVTVAPEPSPVMLAAVGLMILWMRYRPGLILRTIPARQKFYALTAAIWLSGILTTFAAGNPPIASAGFGQSLPVVLEIVGLDGSHSLDPQRLPLTYQWTQTRGPAAQLLMPQSAQAAFKPAGAGTYEFQLTVSDASSTSSPSRVVFYLGQVPPVADAGQTLFVGRVQTTVSLDGTGSFTPNSSAPLQYAWRQLSGPPLALVQSNVAKPKFVHVPILANSTESVFELVVSADGLTSEPSTVKVVSVPNWGLSPAFTQLNPPFDTNKPTIIGFSGGNCDSGTAMSFPNSWAALANLLTVNYTRDASSPQSVPTYFTYGDELIAFLSYTAPHYNQPIQTMGWSTGCMPSCDVAERLNVTYKDRRYLVNRITFMDSACRFNFDANIADLTSNRAPGKIFWVENYYAIAGFFRPGTLNVEFPRAVAVHATPPTWYPSSWNMGDPYAASNFNNGVFAGAFFSVIGPGKNYQLETAQSEYYFGWTNGISGSANYALSNLVQIAPTVYPARLPGLVELNGPTNGTLAPPRRTVFSCLPTLNAATYQILVGPDAQHMTNIAWEGSAPPTVPLPDLPYGTTWWTIRAADAYGSTSQADPRYVRRDSDNDGLSDEDEVLIYHTDPYNADTDGDGHPDGQEVLAGTDPLVPNFGFQLSCQMLAPNQIQLSWPCDPGMAYVLEYSQTLDAPSWEPVMSLPPPAGVIQSVTVTPTNASGFYRVEAVRPQTP